MAINATTTNADIALINNGVFGNILIRYILILIIDSNIGNPKINNKTIDIKIDESINNIEIKNNITSPNFVLSKTEYNTTNNNTINANAPKPKNDFTRNGIYAFIINSKLKA